MPTIAIIGAGLAGCEAALVLARRDIDVMLYEMRPVRTTPAHATDLPAELVCSNSLKSSLLPSAHGLLKKELEILDSPLLVAAHETAVAAGSALAVDRLAFSRRVLDRLESSPGIRLIRQEITHPPADANACIIATGPLTSDALVSWVMSTFTAEALRFYDAIAPIISADSIDMSIAFSASRWEDDGGDYINCPMSKDEYLHFLNELRTADRADARTFEEARFFEGCLPIEVMAERGDKALAFGPLRPIGLTDPRTGRRPYAVCQLRRETASGESFNMVGFQTRLRIPEQQRVFRLIPGLANAGFLRYGSIHRNTYLDSPRLLSSTLSFRNHPEIFLAGQLCGNEGYTESIATGHLAAIFSAGFVTGREIPPPPVSTALGALLNHVVASPGKPFTPSGINFGLFPSLEGSPPRKIPKHQKQELLCERALGALGEWREKTTTNLH